MDYYNFDNNNNNTIIDLKKKIKKGLVHAILFVLGGFILAIVLTVKFIGEDGYIGEVAPEEWIFVLLIPIVFGMMILFIPMNKIMKEIKSFSKFNNTREISTEQSIRAPEQHLNILKNAKYVLIILTVIIFDSLIFFIVLVKYSG